MSRFSTWAGRRVQLAAFVLAALSLAGAAEPAAARTFVGIGIGLPVYGPVYAPPPVWYAPPPPVVVAPPPAYVPAPPAAAAAAPPSASTCREYQTSINVGGVMQPSYGTACRQPDGTWRIVN